jgi:hypothetical protein
VMDIGALALTWKSVQSHGASTAPAKAPVAHSNPRSNPSAPTLCPLHYQCKSARSSGYSVVSPNVSFGSLCKSQSVNISAFDSLHALGKVEKTLHGSLVSVEDAR